MTGAEMPELLQQLTVLSELANTARYISECFSINISKDTSECVKTKG
jgi:hypothetical protein